MKTETKYRNDFVKKCNKAGVFAQITEVMNAPGFPDCLLIYDDKSVLVELKVISEIEKENFISFYFEDSQPVWYKNYLYKMNNTNLFLLFKIGKKKHYLIKVTKDLIDNFERVSLNNFSEYTHDYCKVDSLNDVVDFIKDSLVNPF